jgi:hypothetical protein
MFFPEKQGQFRAVGVLIPAAFFIPEIGIGGGKKSEKWFEKDAREGISLNCSLGDSHI